MLDMRTYTFLEVYRCRNVTRAAARLNITQPAASQHLRHLERHYGCALFRKQGRSIEPTAAGDLLYQALSTQVNDERRLMAELAALAAHDGQRAAGMRLRLGATRTIGAFVMPQLIVAHLKDRPTDDLSLVVDNTHELVRLLEHGELDAALVEGPFDRGAFDAAVVAHESFAAVAAPQVAAGLGGTGADAETDAAAPRLSDLLALPLILREAGSGTREILERHLAAHDLGTADFARTIELGSIGAIKASAAAGLGVSFLYRIAAAPELAAGALADVTPTDLAISHDFTLIWQRGSRYAERYRTLAAAWARSLASDAYPAYTSPKRCAASSLSM